MRNQVSALQSRIKKRQEVNSLNKIIEDKNKRLEILYKIII